MAVVRSTNARSERPENDREYGDSYGRTVLSLQHKQLLVGDFVGWLCFGVGREILAFHKHAIKCNCPSVHTSKIEQLKTPMILRVQWNARIRSSQCPSRCIHLWGRNESAASDSSGSTTCFPHKFSIRIPHLMHVPRRIAAITNSADTPKRTARHHPKLRLHLEMLQVWTHARVTVETTDAFGY